MSPFVQVPGEAGFCTAAWRFQMCVSVTGVSGGRGGGAQS